MRKVDNKILRQLDFNKTVCLELDGDLAFFRILLSIQHELHRLSQSTQRDYGITTTQMVIMQIASRFPGTTPSRLAVSLSIPLSTLSGILAKMKRLKLVRLRLDKGDERRTLIFVSNKGSALLIKADTNFKRALYEAGARPAVSPLECTKKHLSDLVDILKAQRPASI